MLLSGIKKTTLIDYPGKIATIVFTLGCNLRCGYCHNPDFVLPERVREKMADLVDEEAFFSFLASRKGRLDGVVICGGEPTMQKDLVDFCLRIKSLGFLVKLDTNGSAPRVLEELYRVRAIDYVALDIKHAPAKYATLTGDVSVPDLRASITLIKESGMDYEFRTTLIRGIHTETDMGEIVHDLIPGAKRYFLQNFRPGTTLDSHFP